MKIKINISLVICLTLVFTSVAVATDYEPAAGPNYMGFVPLDVAIGSTANVVSWVNAGSAIDTAAIDNLTFLPAGIVNDATTTQGNLFAGAHVWLVPESGGTIDNVAGYANPIVWGYDASVNGVNRTFATLHFSTVSCGVATLTITAGGTALGGLDPGTTKYTGTITVHPQTITTLTASQNGLDINLAWTKPTGVDTVVVRYRTDGVYPTSISDGNLAYSGALTAYTHTGLTQGLTYRYSIWGLNTASGLYSMSYDTDYEVANSQPAFGTPSPVNGSTGRPTSFSWSIPISDDDLDLFDYRISCSNGQFIDVAGASDGTKSLSISGLTPLTWYKVWVNATDPAGSGLYTREWYNFETSANLPPTFGTPSPVNGAINQNLALTWSITITDPEGNTITAWSIECSNGQSRTGAGTSPQAASLSISGLAYSTLYTVYVNATDSGSGSTTRATYTFTTKANTPPAVPDNPNPPNGQSNWNPSNGRLQCHVSDPDGHSMTVSFYWGNGTLIGTDTVTSGSLARVDVVLNELTTYYWYAIANDGYGGSTKGPTVGNWTFITKKAIVGGGMEGIGNEVLFLVLLTHEPVPGALLTINAGTSVQAMGDVITTVATGADGYYTFNLPDGSYILTCTAPGVKTYQQVFTVQGDTSGVVYLEQLGGGLPWIILFVVALIICLLAYLIISGKLKK